MKTLRSAVLVLLVPAAAALLLATFRVGPAPRIEIRPHGGALGARGAVHVSVSVPGGRGLAGVRVEVEQNGSSTVLARTSDVPRPAWALTGERRLAREIDVEAGRDAVPGLREGEAVVRVVAERAGTWLRHPAPAVSEARLPVRLAPPALALVSRPLAGQGGSGIVVYRVGPTAIRDGVRAGSWFFPGAARPGGPAGERFVLFGVPWDLDDPSAIRLVAEDDAGNVADVAFVERVLPRPPARDRIELTDEFLHRVVAEIRQQTPSLPDRGSLLESYLEINRDLRRANADELVAIAGRSPAAFLWKESFLPLRGAKVMSRFADQRTYVHGGREVDRQTHLGFDLASTAQAVVPAANAGRVALARYFGIYGNAVVLDHGFGLLTLYAHLSSIDVAEGQEVVRGARLGRTGHTGLAGGDHLHFTTLVGGLPVTPTEWWDPRWLRDRVARPLGLAIVPGDEAAGVAAPPPAALARRR
jgi:hypothetical protein